MCEKTIRAKFRKNGLKIKVIREIYTGVKCFQVYGEDNNLVAQDNNLQDLYRRFFD